MNQEKQNRAKSGTASNRQKKGKFKKKLKLQSGALKVKMRPDSQLRHKIRRAGNKIFMYDPSSKDKAAFRDKCSEYTPKHPLEGAISVSMTFGMPRPKAHYRTGRYSHLLKENAPKLHTSKPDIDNMVKFYLDAMTGSFWKDDAYVCTVEASKAYADEGLVEIEYWNSPE